jgi:hypothetical protein
MILLSGKVIELKIDSDISASAFARNLAELGIICLRTDCVRKQG